MKDVVRPAAPSRSLSWFASRVIYHAWALAAAALLGLTACQSSRGSGESGHASIMINGRPVGEVRLVAKQVFNEQGYLLTSSLSNLMVFERPGDGGDGLLYGNWGGGVVERLRVRFATSGETAVNVVLTVYAVRDAGDRVMEEEARKLILGRGAYTKMLEEIQRRCQAAPPPAAP